MLTAIIFASSYNGYDAVYVAIFGLLASIACSDIIAAINVAALVMFSVEGKRKIYENQVCKCFVRT